MSTITSLGTPRCLYVEKNHFSTVFCVAQNHLGVFFFSLLPGLGVSLPLCIIQCESKSNPFDIEMKDVVIQWQCSTSGTKFYQMVHHTRSVHDLLWLLVIPFIVFFLPFAIVKTVSLTHWPQCFLLGVRAKGTRTNIQLVLAEVNDAQVLPKRFNSSACVFWLSIVLFMSVLLRFFLAFRWSRWRTVQ